jgi:hypothetical protein
MTKGAERFSPLTCILSLIMGEKLMNGEYGDWIPACAGMTVGAGVRYDCGRKYFALRLKVLHQPAAEYLRETRPYREETEWRLWKLDSCLRRASRMTNPGGEVFSPHLYSLPYHGREVNEWRVWWLDSRSVLYILP